MQPESARHNEGMVLTGQPSIEFVRSARLRGLTAVVTGAAHGIGRAYAERLGNEGANVVVADLDEEVAQLAARELSQQGIAATAVRTDVSENESVREMANAALTRFGRIDIVVNNAGMFNVVPMSRGGFESIEIDEFMRMLQVNVIGSWLVARATVPDMRLRGWGKIINVSSGAVFKGLPGRIHYVSSKAAVVGFTRTLARELGPQGIRVNCIAPGSTLSEEHPDTSALQMRQGAIADRAIPTIERPDDLVGTVAFLASHDSDFMTGQTLIVDGGSVMR